MGFVVEFFKDVYLDFVVSSFMLCFKEMVEIILWYYLDVELKLYDGLWEISYGFWEGKFELEIEDSFFGLLK